MIGGESYIKLVKAYFSYLDMEYGFMRLAEKIQGNAFYGIEYTDGQKIVSVSYENITDYFTVIFFLLKEGERPNYDDKEKTLHLDKLNVKVFSVADNDEIQLNTKYFSKFKATSETEKKLLKAAKELRLCLKYFDKLTI